MTKCVNCNISLSTAISKIPHLVWKPQTTKLFYLNTQNNQIKLVYFI